MRQISRALGQQLLCSALLGSLLIYTAPAAFAWNPYGHMLVAYVAWEKMTPETRTRASQLLRLNPYYESWKKHIGVTKTAEELDMKVFMMAATWPDAIKGDKSFQTDGSEGGFRPKGPSASQNTGYDDKQLHMYWHFYDKPFSNDKKAELPEIPAPNSETQMAAFRKVLSGSESDALKSYDLTWLIHIVGDIHQPLHGITRVSEQYKHGDNGGNLVKISCPDCPKRYNLHWFWDAALGETGDPKTIPNPEVVLAAASSLHKAKKRDAQNLEVDTWVQDSFKIARDSIYKPLGAGNGPFQLDAKYKKRSKEIAAKQGELAGERLANLLNAELK